MSWGESINLQSRRLEGNKTNCSFTASGYPPSSFGGTIWGPIRTRALAFSSEEISGTCESRDLESTGSDAATGCFFWKMLKKNAMVRVRRYDLGDGVVKGLLAGGESDSWGAVPMMSSTLLVLLLSVKAQRWRARRCWCCSCLSTLSDEGWHGFSEFLLLLCVNIFVARYKKVRWVSLFPSPFTIYEHAFTSQPDSPVMNFRH